MTEDRIDMLADKWLKGTISAAERQELETWYGIYESLEQEVSSDQDEEAFGDRLFNLIAARAGIEPALITGDAERVNIKTKLWPRIAAVAAAVALIVLGVYFFNAPRHSDPALSSRVSRDLNDIAPGKNGATLTFASGKVIQLSDAKSGVVIGDDKLAYNDGEILRDALDDKKGESSAVASTAKGQTYIFTLPDGTKVWLNAASKLEISSSFSGKRVRSVKLEGEAYFEVAKNKKRSFIVESNGQEVEVLGTHFNVSAYSDERSIKTTLLEGSVRIKAANEQKTISPGEQALLGKSGMLTVSNVDTELAVAWKNNKFIFDGSDMETIMRMVSRWYNVDVIYQGQVPAIQIEGSVSRFDNISSVMQILQSTSNIKFKLEGRKLYVIP